MMQRRLHGPHSLSDEDALPPDGRGGVAGNPLAVEFQSDCLRV